MQAEGIASWLNSTHDFGTFKEEVGNVTCVMKMVNTGDSNIRITNVRPTCGCTASRYTMKDVSPGDTAEVMLTYNPANRPGRFEKDVYVYTDGTPEKSILTIKGNVIGSPATINSQYPVSVGSLKLATDIMLFNRLIKGKSHTQFISVYNQSEDTIVAEFDNVPKHLKVAMVPSKVPAGEQATITINFRSGDCEEWGTFSNEFVIKTISVNAAGDAVVGEGTIEVHATVEENFSKLSDEQRKNAPVAKLSTEKVDFVKINAEADEVKGHFFITNTGKSNLKIRRIYTIDKGVSLKCKKNELKPGKTAKVDIIITPNELDKMLNAGVTVITNDPDNSNQNVRLVGQLVK